MPRIFRVFALYTAVAGAPFVAAPVAATTPTVSDSLYQAHHPRLLFSQPDVPALRAKVVDGGYDDTAYAYLRYLAESYYPALTVADLAGSNYGLNTIPNLGLAAFLESPVDTVALALGRDATVYIADNYGVDNDEANSGLRLRALALGYDMFFAEAPESLRTSVRDEIVGYLEYMTTNFTYELFGYRPYLANHSAMYAGPLGMAAICLQDEADSLLLGDAMAHADGIIDSVFAHQFDPGGAYKEGCLYGAWTLRQLVPYFDARERFDGFDYSTHPKVRNAERWFAYEVLPEGWGKTNNLNDSPYTTTPLARHSTYIDWAQSAWGSGLAAWLWEHTSGPYGVNLGVGADKSSTVLYNQGLTPVHPDSLLDHHAIWPDRGLYYYRTGWQSGMSSDDVVFSFYSGKFHGGHAQEDQNQFTLYAYGGKFAIDHGGGGVGKQSESHNMVFVDGAGQHNAGSSIGTDGEIAGHLTSGFADHLLGDATDAYTTYSEFNAPDWPFPGWDWSWGYVGANPVNSALRNVVVVHDAEKPPYFVILDDIEKDGTLHDYQWRMHTLFTNTVDVSANPIRIDAPGGASALDLHVLHPEFTSLTRATQSYDNGVADPNSTLLKLTSSAVNPRFAMLLFPSDASVTIPVVTRESHPWGFACRLDWGDDTADVVIGNHSGGTVSWGPDSIRTDASIAVVRAAGTTITRHLLVEATMLDFGGTEYVRFYDAPATCALAGEVIRMSRADASFKLRDTGVERVECRDSSVTFVRGSGYLFSDEVVSVPAEEAVPGRGVNISVYPNPFNPDVTVRIVAPAKSRVKGAVYDAAGRPVRVLFDAVTTADVTTVRWDGLNRSGRAVPSGVYFLKVSAAGGQITRKLVIVK